MTYGHRIAQKLISMLSRKPGIGLFNPWTQKSTLEISSDAPDKPLKFRPRVKIEYASLPELYEDFLGRPDSQWKARLLYLANVGAHFGRGTFSITVSVSGAGTKPSPRAKRVTRNFPAFEFRPILNIDPSVHKELHNELVGLSSKQAQQRLILLAVAGVLTTRMALLPGTAPEVVQSNPVGRRDVSPAPPVVSSGSHQPPAAEPTSHHIVVKAPPGLAELLG